MPGNRPRSPHEGLSCLSLRRALFSPVSGESHNAVQGTLSNARIRERSLALSAHAAWATSVADARQCHTRCKAARSGTTLRSRQISPTIAAPRPHGTWLDEVTPESNRSSVGEAHHSTPHPTGLEDELRGRPQTRLVTRSPPPTSGLCPQGLDSSRPRLPGWLLRTATRLSSTCGVTRRLARGSDEALAQPPPVLRVGDAPK